MGEIKLSELKKTDLELINEFRQQIQSATVRTHDAVEILKQELIKKNATIRNR